MTQKSKDPNRPYAPLIMFMFLYAGFCYMNHYVYQGLSYRLGGTSPEDLIAFRYHRWRTEEVWQYLSLAYLLTSFLAAKWRWGIYFLLAAAAGQFGLFVYGLTQYDGRWTDLLISLVVFSLYYGLRRADSAKRKM